MENYTMGQTDFRNGILYDTESRLIAKVRYEEVGEKIFIQVLEQVVPKIPQEAFLVMKTGSNHNIAFLVSLHVLHSNQAIHTHATLLGHRINDTRTKGNSRGDLRVGVEIPVRLESLSLKTSVNALLKNISAGGVFFLAEDAFSVGMHIFFDLPIEKNTIPMSAKIINKVPTEKENIWGYGCCFVSIDTTSESKIRQFVFQEDCRYRMHMKLKLERRS